VGRRHPRGINEFSREPETHWSPRLAVWRQTRLRFLAALNSSTNARAANTFVPAAGNVCRDASHSADRHVERGGDNTAYVRFLRREIVRADLCGFDSF
jgi:hypothetical protein